jgi:gamma-glutamyl-gamma-aminobutyrate hydrolase PuuD
MMIACVVRVIRKYEKNIFSICHGMSYVVMKFKLQLPRPLRRIIKTLKHRCRNQLHRRHNNQEILKMSKTRKRH